MVTIIFPDRDTLFGEWLFPRLAYHRGMLRGRPQSLSIQWN
jgi:hypothetical protein